MVVRLRLQLSARLDRVSELFTFFPKKKKAEDVTIDQDGDTLIITGEQVVSSDYALARFQLMLMVTLINKGKAWLAQNDLPLSKRERNRLLTLLNQRLDDLTKQRMENYWATNEEV